MDCFGCCRCPHSRDSVAKVKKKIPLEWVILIVEVVVMALFIMAVSLYLGLW